MSNPPTAFIPAKPRRYGRRREAPSVAAAPVLVSASYDPGGPTLSLTFDGAVDVAGFDGSAVVVNDPVSMSARYDGSGGATLTGPESVDVALVAVDLPSGTAVTMTATAGTGIVSATGAAAWAGVTGLELPWP